MDQDLVKKEYDDLVPAYKNLEVKLTKLLEDFLKENNISYHTINSRIKDRDSYIEKIDRKGYTDHKNEIEDLCGLRIICYYPEDLNKVDAIIKNEFKIIECINKSDLLEPDRFGYRSDHYIVTIKDEWATVPDYRKLKGLKAEIQLRTILMHAWADIEHKLAYKNTEQIPPQFRRQLYQLSALLEIADAQFQRLKDERARLKESLIIKSSTEEEFFDADQDLNLDTLQALLDFHFPTRRVIIEDTAKLLDELKALGIDLKQINENVNLVKKHEANLEQKRNLEPNTWTQAGALRAMLDISNDDYFEWREKKLRHVIGWAKTVPKVRDEFKISIQRK